MNENPYDFINNAGTKTNVRPSKKVLILAGIFIVVLVIIIMAIAFGGKKSNSDILLPIAGTQADIVELTSNSTKEIRDSELLKQATTANLVITSQSNITNGYLGKSTKKIKDFRNTSYKQTLEQSKSSGNYDDTYKTTLNQKLDLYKQQVVNAYGQSNDGKIKKQLSQFNDAIAVLRP